jgi:hypothetical protein
MPLDLPEPVTWTPSGLKCNNGPEGGVTGGGMYCDLSTDWSVPAAMTYLTL